jgi:hypothetical protein
MHIVKSVGVMSIAKIMGLLYGCMGLLASPLFLLIGLVSSMANRGGSGAAGIFGAGLLGIVLAVLMPLIYGVMGFVIGAIGGLLYNVLARWLGGVELELELRPTTLTAPYPLIPPAASPTGA